MEWTWLGLGLIAGVGVAVRRLPLLWRIGAGALGASLTFFVASNFGTWLTSGMYSHDIAGLIQCYVAALPFLRTTIVSDLLFSGLLLSAYEVVLTQRDNNTKHESVHPILTAKTTDPQSALD